MHAKYLKVLYRGQDGDRALEFEVRGDVTVAAVLGALDPDAGSRGATLAVDGVVVDLAATMGEGIWRRGSLVELVEPHVPPMTGEPTASGRSGRGGRVALAVTGGPCAGQVHRLPSDGAHVVGRRSTAAVTIADETVCPEHLLLEIDRHGVTVADLGSHNGTRADGAALRGRCRLGPGVLLGLGATEVEVRMLDEDDRPGYLAGARPASDGTVLFNRPPRAAPVLGLDPIPVPDPPANATRRAAFDIAALIGPVLMGLVMVRLLGNVRYALFALMAPVLMISNHLVTARRNAKECKTSRRRFNRELEHFGAALAEAGEVARKAFGQRAPDLAEVVRRGVLPSNRLWERRPDHRDYLRLRVGRGSRQWAPPVEQRRLETNGRLQQAVENASVLDRCPIEVDLAGGGLVGLVGERELALGLARSLLVQACVFHGPADLELAVLTLHPDRWEWSKWLPHVARRDDRGAPLLCGSVESAHAAMQRLMRAGSSRSGSPRAGAGPCGGSSDATHSEGRGSEASLMVVVDGVALLSGRRSPVRSVLAGDGPAVAGIVIAHRVDELPAQCQTIVELRDDLGDAVVRWPARGQKVDPVLVAALAEPLAGEVARRLAGLHDPDVDARTDPLPRRVSLSSCFAVGDVDAATIGEAWAEAGADPPLRAHLGLGPHGPVIVDLVADGPHALVGGTTGSGKSELLRSIIAGLALQVSPEQLVFMLVDYKGGSAFDACARLPHTVGVVTDLDAPLAERALVSLEAELRHRERLLRAAGAGDLAAYRASGAPRGPLSRLVLVVDEFATLASELPDFVDSLVGVAQRGRSLGIHMILATQRPSGAVNANIKANTNIRVALRVQDAAESMDIVDDPGAAFISRTTPGRAFVRLGPGELATTQTPLVTSAAPERAGIDVRPFRFGQPDATAPPGGQNDGVGADGELDRLVELCRATSEACSCAPPRRPWLPMLPVALPLIDLLGSWSGAETVPIGLLDDPANQAQPPFEWSGATGHLGLFGMVGSGAATALSTCVLATASLAAPEEVHIYALDFGGSLRALAELPHVGAVVAAHEAERLVRCIEHLAAEIDRRRSLGVAERAGQPRVLVAIDDLPAGLREIEVELGAEVAASLKRILSDGAPLGVAVAFTADRLGAVSMGVSGSVSTKLVFRHAEPGDYAALGLRARDLPEMVPGRAVHADSGLLVQTADVDDPRALVAAIGAGVAGRSAVMGDRAVAIGVLPAAVPMAAVVDRVRPGEPIELPLGVGAADLGVEVLTLGRGEHLLVAGNAHSGVSTGLRSLARLVKQASPRTVLVGVADRDSPVRADVSLFDGLGTLDELEAVLALAAVDREREWVVVVDDAHLLDAPPGVEDLLRAAHCRFVVGGRADHLQGRVGHWTRSVRRCGSGVLLRPRLESDGDLLGVRLPRRLSVPMPAGRGFVVRGGVAKLVQMAGADLAASGAGGS